MAQTGLHTGVIWPHVFDSQKCLGN